MRIHAFAQQLTFFKIVILAASITLTGCSKGNSQHDVTIQFPEWKQLQKKTYAQQSLNSSPTASAVVDNVSIISLSVGGKVINGFPWERKDSSPVAPTGATFSVEKGSLIQALAILEGGGTRIFYYGDAVVGSGDNQTINLNLTNVMTTDMMQGNIIGRYVTGLDATGAPAGPTGTFQYRFNPPGRPPMVVTTGEVFNGWLNVTTFKQGILSYTNLDGSPIFSFSADDETLISTTTPALSTRVLVPPGFSNDNGGGGGFSMRPTGASVMTVGYFGPAVPAAQASLGALSVCYSGVASWPSSVLIDGLYANLAASGSPTETPLNQMMWGGKYTIPVGDRFRSAGVVPVRGVLGGDDTGRGLFGCDQSI